MQCNFAILNKNLTNIFSLRPTVRPVTLGSEELDIEAQKNGLFCALSHFFSPANVCKFNQSKEEISSPESA